LAPNAALSRHEQNSPGFAVNPRCSHGGDVGLGDAGTMLPKVAGVPEITLHLTAGTARNSYITNPRCRCAADRVVQCVPASPSPTSPSWLQRGLTAKPGEFCSCRLKAAFGANPPLTTPATTDFPRPMLQTSERQ